MSAVDRDRLGRLVARVAEVAAEEVVAQERVTAANAALRDVRAAARTARQDLVNYATNGGNHGQ